MYMPPASPPWPTKLAGPHLGWTFTEDTRHRRAPLVIQRDQEVQTRDSWIEVVEDPDRGVDAAVQTDAAETFFLYRCKC